MKTSKKVDGKVYLERLMISSKRSAFRPKEPDIFYVRIMIELPSRATLIAREFTFLDRSLANDHYKHLEGLLL